MYWFLYSFIIKPFLLQKRKKLKFCVYWNPVISLFVSNSNEPIIFRQAFPPYSAGLIREVKNPFFTKDYFFTFQSILDLKLSIPKRKEHKQKCVNNHVKIKIHESWMYGSIVHFKIRNIGNERRASEATCSAHKIVVSSAEVAHKAYTAIWTWNTIGWETWWPNKGVSH